MDGIDASIIQTDGVHYVKHIIGHSKDFDKEFRAILNNARAECISAEGKLYSRKVEEDLTYLHKELIDVLIKKAANLEIDIIGFHGQNLYHNPALKRTIQIGDGKLLSKLVGIPVVTNFREADVMKGGQGAPLAPMYHWALSSRHQDHLPLAIVNIGGISNITCISGHNLENVIGFDTGPGNFLIDKYIQKVSNGAMQMDQDGLIGLSGDVKHCLIQNLLNALPECYLEKRYPKSLDISDFHDINYKGYNTKDICSTLAYFSAMCIMHGCSLLSEAPKKMIVVGGGARNMAIMHYLSSMMNKIGCETLEASSLNWSSRYMEAELFAYLAARRMLGMPTNIPSVTGASSWVIGGDLHE